MAQWSYRAMNPDEMDLEENEMIIVRRFVSGMGTKAPRYDIHACCQSSLSPNLNSHTTQTHRSPVKPLMAGGQGKELLRIPSSACFLPTMYAQPLIRRLQTSCNTGGSPPPPLCRSKGRRRRSHHPS